MQERKKYEQAFLDGEKYASQLNHHTLLGIGEKLLEYLLNELDDAPKCADYCPRVRRVSALLAVA
jgi:hypothetical protein